MISINQFAKCTNWHRWIWNHYMYLTSIYVCLWCVPLSVGKSVRLWGGGSEVDLPTLMIRCKCLCIPLNIESYYIWCLVHRHGIHCIEHIATSKRMRQANSLFHRLRLRQYEMNRMNERYHLYIICWCCFIYFFHSI